MSKVNSVRLIGNVGAKPEKVVLNDGRVIFTFSMATTEHFKKQDGTKDSNTQWHKIICFGRITSVIENYVKKGDRILVEGKLQTRQYVDKDGVNRYLTEIVMEEVLLLSNKTTEEMTNNANPTNQS